MSEQTIPRIDPSGAFTPVARLKIAAPVPFLTTVAKVVPFVVDYMKGDCGRFLSTPVGGSNLAIGPGLYLAQCDFVLSVAQTSIVADLTVENNKVGGNYSEEKQAIAPRVVQLTCQALLLPGEPFISVPDDVYGIVALSLTATGTSGNITDASILLTKLASF